MTSRRERPLGEVALVQLQPHGLIIETPGTTPTGSFYDAGRRVEVDRLRITPRGIEATLPGGEDTLDACGVDGRMASKGLILTMSVISKQ